MELFLLFVIFLLGLIGGLVGVFYVRLARKKTESPSEFPLPEEKFQRQTNEVEDQDESSDQVIMDDFMLTKRIFELFVREEVFKVQGLTVAQFAKRLGVNSRVVTRVLDKLAGHTFKELTNAYRVKYAAEKIEEGYLDRYTMDALGKEAGFNSRVTFFNVFKKEFGVCPKEYWKKTMSAAA